MEDTLQKISFWERKYGHLLVDIGDRTEDDAITRDEFLKDFPHNHRGVAYDDRVAFLKTNGYPVTRENMMDASLSAKES